MNKHIKDQVAKTIAGFSLPSYSEIPNVGLYLEQTSKYVSEYLQPFGEQYLTGSMISNYVKKGLIRNPVKKQYYREQIAYLIFIALAKSVLSMEDIRLLIKMQQQTYDPERAYNYFSKEFSNVLEHVFGLKDSLDTIGVDATHEKDMLRNTIISVVHKIYLEKYFGVLRASDRNE